MTIAARLAGRDADGLDRIDRRILVELQADASLSLAELAARVGLSSTPCWKRVRKLEQARVITGRVALVDAEKVGVGLLAFVWVAAADHSPASREAIGDFVAEEPEVLEAFRTAGDADYLLKVVAPDVPAFDAFYRRLTARLDVRIVSAQFALERVKITTALPLDRPSQAPALGRQ